MTPSYDLPDWDSVLDLAQSAIEASVPMAVLPFDQKNNNLVISLAAAARCRRLLQAVVVLAEAGMLDTIGGLLRSLYETWLDGVYALLGSEEALQRLVNQRDRQMKIFARTLGESTTDLPDGQDLRVEQLARYVSALLENIHHENAGFARAAYDSFYRFLSYRGVHGGLGSFIGHIEEDENTRTILESRPERDDAMRHLILLGTALLVSAAQMPFSAANLPHGDLDEVGRRILALRPAD